MTSKIIEFHALLVGKSAVNETFLDLHKFRAVVVNGNHDLRPISIGSIFPPASKKTPNGNHALDDLPKVEIRDLVRAENRKIVSKSYLSNVTKLRIAIR